MTGKSFSIIRIETEPELSLQELSEACHISTDFILELVEYGVLEPKESSIKVLRFNMQDVGRIRRLMRLHHDLEVNIAGAALAMELMEQIDELRSQVEYLERFFSDH